ncbi:MAG: efflux RND transporter periplasmic adaptor subunit [Planctomycetota bacterium]|nr:efflux RND transporter periplasmic adaptor subunit [Planctomycetales bacterium]REJ90663.1 MAG: efflux RND transporter periplasmic adaptor subunit [Planctomycetota bacterium]REK18304.1 MAG: efflux RND transporter periplasmic adaptor subunit [Planctomycetota bacterium]REK49174.1 MAG: efflux RND transporter periplasmic adaptor subunit [Planctomycetota bacterium]
MKAKFLAVALVSCVVGAAGGVGYSRLVGTVSEADDSPRPAASSRYRAESAPVAVTVARVESRDISATLELTGNLLPRRRTILVSEVDGVIDSIPNSRNNISFELDGQTVTQPLRLDIGQPVNKGDVLVQINRSEYELELKAAEARLAKAERELQELIAWRRPEDIRKLEAALAEAEAQYENAQSVLKRQETLVAQNATSRETYDRAVAQAKLAKAALDRAAAELDIAKRGPTEEQIAVSRAAVAQAQAEVNLRRDELRKTTIVAPYDAVITDRYVDEGEYVTAQPRVELMELMDLSFLTVQVGVPERYLNRVESGDQVRVFVEGASEPVRGLVVLVNDKVEPETRTYRTRVAIDNRDGRFKAGQFARVGFVVANAEDSLVVPDDALVYSGGQPQVFVFEDGRAKLMTIRPGISSGAFTEVLTGLTPGRPVIVDDPSILADGMPVQVREQSAEEAAETD